MTEYLIPLKATLTERKISKGGKYKGRTGNSHGPTPKYAKNRQGLGQRLRQGWGAVSEK